MSADLDSIKEYFDSKFAEFCQKEPRNEQEKKRGSKTQGKPESSEPVAGSFGPN